MLTDLPEAQLWEYRSRVQTPGDYDEFWQETLMRTRAHPLGLRVEAQDSPFTTLTVRDITFAGWGGHPVKAWLTVPSGWSGARLPTVVQFVGYGGGRGVPTEHSLWASCGYAHLVVDTRGQGAAWCRGDTPDPDAGAARVGGFGPITSGLEDPRRYYYRRVFADAVRAVEAASCLEVVDPNRIAVLGGSQGGGIALAAAALVPELVAATVAFVPFLCDFPRAVRITDNPPYSLIADHLRVRRDAVEQVEGTLAYFDGVTMAKRATAPAYFSAGLMDPTCPPSTVFAAFHEYAGAKEMTVWPFGGHEGGGCDDHLGALAFLRRVLHEG